jgi:hypothetical protein
MEFAIMDLFLGYEIIKNISVRASSRRTKKLFT